MKLTDFIKKQRKKYAVDMRDKKDYWFLSGLSLSFFIEIQDVLKKYVKGKTLDAGAGELNLRILLKDYCSEYISMDVEQKQGLDLVSDIQNMKGIDSESFDTVFSAQVLEHVPEPWNACEEIYRILKPGGCAVITVPHLSGLHDLPHDYYRYTPYGIKHLMTKAGFKIKQEKEIGGLLSFLTHYFSLVFVSVFWSIPLINRIVYYINRYIIVKSVLFLDTKLGIKHRFPANVLIVGEK